MQLIGFVADNGCGIVNAAVDLALEQARQGNEVAVVSGGGDFEQVLERAGIRHYTLKHWNRPKILVRALFRLREQVRDFKPDVVHVHMRTGLLLAWFWSKIYRFSLVAHVHNVYDRESVIMGLADRVIVVSRSSADVMQKRGISKKKIRVVLNRTLGSPRIVQLQDIKPATLVSPSIVTVAGLSERKGIAELISAFELLGPQHDGAHLYLVGDGPDREKFELQAKQSRSASRIHFVGFQSVPQAYMLSADIFVLASRRESFPLVLIEARQAGCAIVASDVDGIAEALEGGTAGVLVPPEQPAALAVALANLLDNESERKALKQAALQGIDAYYVDAMAREVGAVYAEIARRPTSKPLARTA